MEKSYFEDKQQREFIVEYFRQLRTEINSRLQINVNLILQKIVTCGASFGFLISQKYDPSTSLVSRDNQLFGFALIPIVAMLYDLLIARNIKSINILANFIRVDIEPRLTTGNMYEEYLYQNVYKSKKISFEGSLLSVLTGGTELAAALIFWNNNKGFLVIILIVLALHVYTFGLSQKMRLYDPESSSADPFF